MSVLPDPLSASQRPAPWGAKGTAGAVFAGRMAFEAVSYAAKGRDIIKDVSFILPAGKIACLLGPSGCGKTTILRLAAGIAVPTAGRILLDDLEVASRSTFIPPERRNVGLMFQDFALFPHLTVLDNVAYGLYALAKRDARNVALRALDRVGLADKAQRYPSMLSGGEQQRVALARVIVPRPQVILMDEPFSGLDLRLKESVRAETLALIRETRATCLLVTHDPGEALAFSELIFLMRDGRIVQQGTPEELIAKPVDAGVASFFRAYNVLTGHVRNGVVETAIGRLPVQQQEEGAKVLVLVPFDGLTCGTAAMDGKSGGPFARIVENRFLGTERQLSVAIEGLPQPFEILTTLDDTRPSGTPCSLAILPGRAQIFPAS